MNQLQKVSWIKLKKKSTETYNFQTALKFEKELNRADV